MPEFRLVGFYNSFQFVPDFVYPVYQYRDTHYFQHVDHGVLTFVPICLPMNTQLISLQECDMIFTSDRLDLYHSYNQQIFAFQIDEHNIIFGNLSYMQAFFKCYLSLYANTLDDILKNKITQLCSRERKFKTKQDAIHVPYKFSMYRMILLRSLQKGNCEDIFDQIFHDQPCEYKSAGIQKRSIPIKNASIRR